MTNSTHTKTIAAAAVIGALAIAAPASASVLEPVSTASYSTTQSSQPNSSEVQTVNAAANSAGGGSVPASASAYTSLNAISHPASTPSTTPVATSSHPFSGQGGQQIALRRDGTQADAFVANVGTPVANSGDGFDWGDAAIGAGAGLLAATLLMLGSSAVGGRRTSSHGKPGGAVSQGA
jgi:hypothetical protein